MITLRLDKKGGINRGDINMIETDNKSDVYIIQLYKGEEVYNLTGKTVELSILEKKRGYGDTFNLPIYEATTGKIKLEVLEGMTKTDGLFYFQITVKDSTGLVDNFPIFPVEIKNSLKDDIIGTVVNSPYMQILLDAVAKAEGAVDIVNDIKTDYDTAKTNLQADYTQTKTALQKDYDTTKTSLQTDYVAIKNNIQSDYNATKTNIQSDYNSLKRVIIDENASANLQEQINKTTEQLDNITKKVNKEYDFIVDGGGKPNDPNFDNSIVLNNLLDKIERENKGGKIKFSNDIFYFNTPIIRSRIQGVTIEGSSTEMNNINTNKGAVLIYNGTETFLTVGILHSSWFRWLSIKSANNTNNCFNITDGFYLSGMEHLYANGFNRTLDTNKGEYGYLSYCSFNGNDVSTESIIRLGNTKIFEFMFIDNCIFGGVSGNNSNIVHIRSVGFLNIKNTDIAGAKNGGRGLFFDNDLNSSGNININECNITHCTIPIKININGKSLFNTKISNCRVYVEREKGEGVNIIEASRVSGDLAEVFFEDMYVRTTGNSDYFIKVLTNNNVFTNSSIFELKNSNLISSGTLKFDLGSNDCLAKISDFRLTKAYKIDITGDNSKTSFDIKMANVSPFRYSNGVHFNVISQVFIPFRVLPLNTHEGELICRVIFSSPPPTGTYRLYIENTCLPIVGGQVW